MKLVSGNGISDFSVADEEMVMTKLAAAFKKGDDDLKELSSGNKYWPITLSSLFLQMTT